MPNSLLGYNSWYWVNIKTNGSNVILHSTSQCQICLNIDMLLLVALIPVLTFNHAYTLSKCNSNEGLKNYKSINRQIEGHV